MIKSLGLTLVWPFVSAGGPPSGLPHLHPTGPPGHGAVALLLPGPQCQPDVRAPGGPGQRGALFHRLQVRRALFVCLYHSLVLIGQFRSRVVHSVSITGHLYL